MIYQVANTLLHFSVFCFLHFRSSGQKNLVLWFLFSRSSGFGLMYPSPKWPLTYRNSNFKSPWIQLTIYSMFLVSINKWRHNLKVGGKTLTFNLIAAVVDSWNSTKQHLDFFYLNCSKVKKVKNSKSQNSKRTKKISSKNCSKSKVKKDTNYNRKWKIL